MTGKLPDELLQEILAIRLSVDYRTFAKRSPEGLITRRSEALELLLVSRRWQRIALPLMCETILLASQQDAKILASLLTRHKGIGARVKKLRLEGAYGQILRKILISLPNLSYLSVSLTVASKKVAQGLCAGLRRVNPEYVVVHDKGQRFTNQGERNVVDSLIECMTSVWTNMRWYSHPDDVGEGPSNWRSYSARRDRARDLALALPRIPKLEVVYVTFPIYTVKILEHDPDNVILCALKNRAVRGIYSRGIWSDPNILNAQNLQEVLNLHPRLRELLHFPVRGPSIPSLDYAAIGNRNT
ncbi:hypothetical protein H1R20_g4364, partial [Candolleomyces eurysporus]